MKSWTCTTAEPVCAPLRQPARALWALRTACCLRSRTDWRTAPLLSKREGLVNRGAHGRQYALKLDKLNRKADPRGGTARLEHKARPAATAASGCYARLQKWEALYRAVSAGDMDA